MAGKGDGRRPGAVPEKIVDDNWARTFGSVKPPRPTPPDTEPKDDNAKPYLLFNRSGDTKPR